MIEEKIHGLEGRRYIPSESMKRRSRIDDWRLLSLSRETDFDFLDKVGDDEFLKEPSTRDLLEIPTAEELLGPETLKFLDMGMGHGDFEEGIEKEKKEVEEKLSVFEFYGKHLPMGELVKKAFVPDELGFELEDDILPIVEDRGIGDESLSLPNKSMAEELVSEELLELFNEEKAVEKKKVVKDLLIRELGDTDLDIETITDEMPKFLLNYLQDWDELEMDVPSNPMLKKTILKNIINSAEGLKSNSNKDKLEFLVDLQKKVEEVVAKSHFFRATDYNVMVNNILGGDKRWKSQFETNTSGGTMRPLFRSSVEKLMFGFPDDTDHDKENRPIYGFFTPDENGILNREGKHPPLNSTSQYGKVHCRVKKQVALSRATLTFSDSLGDKEEKPPTPAAKPSLLSIKNVGYGLPSVDIIKDFIDGDDITPSLVSKIISYTFSGYTEVQYHNGLSLSDIESIHVSVENGIDATQIAELREIIKKYNEENPSQTIEFVVY